MFAASRPDCITADKNSIHAHDFGQTLAGSTVGEAVCFVFSIFPFHFFFSHKKDPERYEEPLFFQQQLASARTSTEVSAAKPTPSIDTTHEDGGRCSSRRKLRGISFREKKKKREDNHLKQAFVFLSFTKYILFSSLKPSVRHSGVLYIPPHSALWNLLRSAPKTQKK